MKKTLILASTLCLSLSALAVDEPSQAGDNLDLNGVLQLFEQSKTVEEFENKLNTDRDVNNLDLNEDGFVDYIRVIDYTEGNVHSLTLQVPYSDGESQDVAVLLLEDQGNESTVLQIVGDEELYGADHLVEPGVEGKDEVVNVYHWNAVRYVYTPGYSPWRSPWNYGRYPAWYSPRKPIAWAVYHSRVRNYPIACRRYHAHRCHVAHAHYRRHHVHSHTYKAHHPHAGNHHKAGEGARRTSVQPANRKVSQGIKGTPSTPAPSNQPNNARDMDPGSPAPGNHNQADGKPTKRPGGTKPSGNKGGGNNGGKKKGG